VAKRLRQEAALVHNALAAGTPALRGDHSSPGCQAHRAN